MNERREGERNTHTHTHTQVYIIIHTPAAKPSSSAKKRMRRLMARRCSPGHWRKTCLTLMGVVDAEPAVADTVTAATGCAVSTPLASPEESGPAPALSQGNAEVEVEGETRPL